MRSRLAAWLLTGPLGHGLAGALDAAALALALARGRWTRRPRRLR